MNIDESFYHFKAALNNNEEVVDVYATPNFREYVIGSNTIDFQKLLNDYTIKEISEETAKAGFDEVIFPEYFAPFLSAEELAAYIEERKETIAGFLMQADISAKDIKDIESRPELYGPDFFDDLMYEDSVRVVLTGIVPAKDYGYRYKNIAIEILDIPIAKFDYSKDDDRYAIEITAESYVGDRGNVLNDACMNVILSSADDSKALCLHELIKDKSGHEKAAERSI